MKRARFFLLVPFVVATAAAQTTVETALGEARDDLADALKRLDEVRVEIGNERPELAAEFHRVETELRTKRRQARLARTAVEDRREMRRELETTHYQLGQDAIWMAGLLKDHALKMQTQTDPGMPALGIEQDAIAGGSRDAASLQRRAAVLQASVKRLAAMMGGSSAAGEVAGPEGEIFAGTLVALGPESWFSSEDGRVGGPVVADRSGAAPRLLAGDAKAAAELVAGNEATLALDFTNGKARSLAQADDRSLARAIRSGGLWIWPIFGLALLSLVFGIVKLLQFRKVRDPGDGWLEAILDHMRRGDATGAREHAERASHPAGEVVARAVAVAGQGTEAMEETIYEQLIRVKAWAGSLLPVIAVTAATAPLLGLLGTVSGMIRTFNLITLFGSGDPKPLAGGISEALITTFFGLTVAIPALLLHAFLSRRSQGILQTSERLGLAFVNGLREPRETPGVSTAPLPALGPPPARNPGPA